MAATPSSRDLTGKVALVTGGGVRVGRALVLGLAAAGCDVLIHYGRSEGPARETAAAVEALGRRAATHSADLADASAVPGVVEAALAAFGRLDILVNSAAVFLDGTLAETTLAMWDDQHAINLRAPFLLSQRFAAHVRERVGEAGAAEREPTVEGQIVNVLDARTFRPAPDHFAYRMTKAALSTMTEVLAHDLAPSMTVNGVALGAILPPPGEEPEYLDRLVAERVPLRRAGGTDPVVASALHLLRQPFLTGVIVRVDGGEFL